MEKIAILIPCFNESKTIEKVICDFKRYLPDARIYVYDNNSTDKTDEIAQRAGAVVQYENRQGKGNVVRSMFKDIEADCYIMVDGDDTYSAEHAGAMADLVLEGKADMVIGDRLSSSYFTENKRLFHNAGNRLVRFMTNFVFRSSVRDIMTGYRAFSYRFVKTFPVLCSGFEIETEMTFHALDKKLNVENIVIEYRDRPQGSQSKLNTYLDGFRVLKTIGKLFKNYRPLLFLSMLAAALFLLAVLLVIPVLSDYIHTGRVDRFPTLITSGFLLVAAIQSLFGGLILDVIAHNNKQSFEILLNKMYVDRVKGDKADDDK